MNMRWRVIVVPHADNDSEEDGKRGHRKDACLVGIDLAWRFGLDLSVGSRLVYFWYGSNRKATCSALLF
jgi:hypothetical protein